MNLFDLHCDTATECYEKKQPFSEGSTAVTAQSGICFEKWKQCFAIWIKDGEPSPYAYYKAVLADLKTKLSDKPDNLYPLLTVEGGSVIENDISRLSALKNDGVMALTLTWNGKNLIASGAAESGGLSDFGRAVINEMNRFSIACDLSHLNNESFWDAVDVAETALATHSCCNAVFCHRRNLDDGQIKAIASKGGIIGLCCYPPFLGGCVYEGLLANIRHMLDMGLENHIAFGSDFDGGVMDPKLNSPARLPQLFDYLAENDVSCSVIDKIFYENADNFFDKQQFLL